MTVAVGAPPPPHPAKAAASIQSQTTSGPSSISQEAGRRRWRSARAGEPVANMVAAFLRRRDRVSDRLRAAHPGSSSAPEGAFYLFPDVSALVGPGCEAKDFGPVEDADELCRYLLEKAQVALVPGSAFGTPECVRISYAASDETLDEALDRIEKALKSDVYTVA